MPENKIYGFLKENKLTDLDEKSWIDKYSKPENAKQVYSFFKENQLTDLDELSFTDKYLKKKEPLVLGFESATEASRIGGLKKPEKLSQSPLKTAATTTPSVSTKPKKNIDYLTDINNLYKEKVSTSQERVNTKKELLNLQPQIENAYSQIEELNAIYNDVNLPIQERNEAAKSANLLLEQVQPIKSKYDELGLKYNDLVQKDKQAISKLKELDNQRQLQLQKEFSIGKDLLEKTGKGFVDAAAGVAGIFNTLGLSGDTEGGDDYDQEEVKQQTRQNIDKIRAFGNSLVTQETPQEWQSVFKGKFSPKKLAYITSQAVSSTVPTVAAGLFTGIGGVNAFTGANVLGAGSAGTALIGAAMGFNESKDILKEAGLNDAQAEWASLGLSIPLGLLEEYGAGDVVKILSSPMVKKKVANELVKNIAGKQITKELLFNETKKSLGKVIADNAGSILTTGVKESGTEVGQGTLQEIAKQTAQEYTGVNPDEQMPFEEYLKEFATQRGEEAVGGFLGGTALSGAGKALQAGLSVFKPNFTPSVYAQVKEFKDPDKLQEFEQDLQEEMEQGIITPEQVDEVMKNVQAIKEADDLIPNNITDNDVRAKAVNLIIEKNNIEKDIEGKDKSLVTPQSERLKEIDEQLVSISKGKIIEEQLTEEQDEQGRIEEPINRGTDVLEEGIGVAVEPNKEGIAGEDIQTEEILTPQEDAIQEFSTSEVFPREQEEIRETGSEREGVGQGEQRQEITPPSTEEVVSERVSEIEPPVVEQTTADVGGVTSPDVSEALKDVESTAKALGTSSLKFTDTPSLKNAEAISLEDANLSATVEVNAIQTINQNNENESWDKALRGGAKNVGNGWFKVGSTMSGESILYSPEQNKAIVIKGAKSDEIAVQDFVRNNFGNPKKTAEAYHKAKADDSNPELVAAVEKLLGAQPTPSPKEEVAPQEEPTPPKEEGEGDFEARQEKAKEETAEVRKENNNISYRQAVNLVNKYVREVKPNETITPQEIQQAFQNKEQGNTREGWTQPSKEGGDKERAISKKFEFNGVELPASIKYYAPITFEEARVKAKEVLDKLGLEKTIELITKMPDWLDSRFIPAIGNAAVLEIQRLQDIAASKNDMVELDRLADLNLDVHNLIAPLTTHNAQYLAMMRVFYEGHEYNQLKEVTKALDKLNSGKIAEFKTLLGELDLINKRIIDQAATNVSKRVATTKVASAKKNYEKSKQHLKDVFRKSSNLGIGETPYDRARKNLEFDRALIRLAKDFVVYQSVKFSEFIKEVSASIGISEEDIDKTHLKGIFDKVKESEIRRGVKGALSDMDLQLKDLIVNHYSELESTELQLVEKLSESFGLAEGDAQEVANLIKDEVRKISYEQKVKAVKNSALKNLGWADELIALSDSGAINNEEVFKKFLDKIGIKQLTDEQSKKLLELAKDAKNEKDPQKQAAKWQDVQDYKSVLTRKYGISDFTVSWYLTNIFGSIGANEINVASNILEQIVLVSGDVFDSLAKGKIQDVAILMGKVGEGLERGSRFTKEVMKTGKATYRGAESIKPRNMWELIMMRDKDDLSNIEAFLQYVFKTPVAGKIFLAERRFWNRALSSMDAFSGVTNIEIGAFYSAKREADKLGLSGKKRADYIRERLGDTKELTKEAEQKATELGYKKGSKKFKQFVVDYKISKRPEAIIEKSRKYSGFATLTQEPPINSFVGAVARAINNQATKSPSTKFLFPVVNTFANLIMKNIERTPFEAISLTMDVIRSRREEASPALKEYVSKEEIDRRLKTAIFWTIFGTAIFVLAGGFDDDDEGFEIYGSGSGDPVLDAERRALGWKPYTIKFSEGGGYYNYEYTPAGLLLAMIGDLRDYMKNADNTLLNLRKKISKDMFGVELDALTKEQRAALEVELFSGKYNAGEKANKKMTEMIFKMGFTPIQYSLSILKSLGDIIGLGESKSPEEKGKKFVSNILRGIVSPRYMGEVKEVFDEKYYDSKKFWNNVVANMPFITFSDGVKLDAFGREVTKYDREQRFAGIKDGLKYLATRRFYNPSRGTDVDKFLFENSIKVSPPQNTVDLSYTEDDYKKYIVRRGQIALEMIGDRIKDSEFMKLTPLQKKEVIDRDLQRANEISKYEINQLIGRIK